MLSEFRSAFCFCNKIAAMWMLNFDVNIYRHPRPIAQRLPTQRLPTQRLPTQRSYGARNPKFINGTTHMAHLRSAEHECISVNRTHPSD